MRNMSQFRYCPKCGAKWPLGTKFCSDCGSRIFDRLDETAQDVKNDVYEKSEISVSDVQEKSISLDEYESFQPEIKPYVHKPLTKQTWFTLLFGTMFILGAIILGITSSIH